MTRSWVSSAGWLGSALQFRERRWMQMPRTSSRGGALGIQPRGDLWCRPRLHFLSGLGTLLYPPRGGGEVTMNRVVFASILKQLPRQPRTRKAEEDELIRGCPKRKWWTLMCSFTVALVNKGFIFQCGHCLALPYCINRWHQFILTSLTLLLRDNALNHKRHICPPLTNIGIINVFLVRYNCNNNFFSFFKVKYGSTHVSHWFLPTKNSSLDVLRS